MKALDIPGVRSTSHIGEGIMVQSLWIVGLAAATAVGARFEIPHQPVPYTLQTLIVLLSGAFLGARNGAISQVLYLVTGLLGAPVFAMGGAGVGTLLGPTGGYLLAFPVAAAVVGSLVGRGRTLAWTFLSMVIGLMIIFLCGTVQLYFVVFKSWSQSILAGFLIFSWWDALKLSAAAMIYHEVAKPGALGRWFDRE